MSIVAFVTALLVVRYRITRALRLVRIKMQIFSECRFLPIMALFRAVYNGCGHPKFKMRARHGHLFGPADFQLGETVVAA